jgi:hypothetical protein
MIVALLMSSRRVAPWRHLFLVVPYGVQFWDLPGEAVASPGWGARWAVYEPPPAEAVLADLHTLRQATVRTRHARAQSCYALMHLPFLSSVDERPYRAELVLEALAEALAHDGLTLEQRTIGRLVLLPSEAHEQQKLHQRRDEAAALIDRKLESAGRRPLHLSRKMVEDREAKILLRIADLLLDGAFGERFMARSGLAMAVNPPLDPYEGKGYEWVRSEHTLKIDPENPRLHTLRYAITIRALRRGQRLFQLRHDPVRPGKEGPLEVLSTGKGHSFLGRVPDPLPNQVDAHMLYFHLGRELPLGETACVEFRRIFEQDEAAHPCFAMEMDAAGQEALVLEVHLPSSLMCVEWRSEEWSSGGAEGHLIATNSFPVNGDAVARYEIAGAKPFAHYRVVWTTGGSHTQGGVPPP